MRLRLASSDADVGFEHLEHPAEIALALAVAIHLRRVEIIDAELDRARDGALLIGGGALGHQPTDRAAAKAEQRYVETGPAELSSFHRRLLRSFSRPIRSPAGPVCQLSGRRAPAETRLTGKFGG